MTYTCIKEFVAQDYPFRLGEKINMTQYIALTAEERLNFIQDFKPLKTKR
jgi:hypothetical protein